MVKKVKSKKSVGSSHGSSKKLRKPSLKKIRAHKKEIVRFFVVLFVLLVIYFLSIYLFQFRGTYAEQIIMENNPQYVNLNLRQGDLVNVSLETDIRTNLFCRVVCDFEFVDLSNDVVLDEGSISFSNQKKHVFEASLSAEKLGSGQDLFLFEISCSTLDSRMCSRTRFPIIRNSLITLNYEPSLEQQLKKREVEGVTEELTGLFQSAKANILSAELKLNNFSHMKKSHLERNVLALRIFEEVVERDLFLIEEFWETQNYSFVLDEIKNRNLMEKAIHFKEDSNVLLEKIESERQIHNLLVDLLVDLEDDLFYFQKLDRANSLALNFFEDVSFSSLVFNDARLRNYLINMDFESYDDIFPLINQTKNLSYEFEENYELILNESNPFSEVHTWLLMMNRDLCLFSNVSNCNNVSLDFDLVSDFDDVDSLFEYSDLLCGEIRDVEESFNLILELQEEKRSELSEDELIRIDSEKKYVESSMIFWEKRQLSEFDSDVLVNYSRSVLNGTFQDSNYYPNEFLEHKKEFFLPADYLREDSSFYFDVCDVSDINVSEVFVQKEDFIDVHVEVPDISVVSEISSTCCFKSECGACCDYDECRLNRRNPLIVLHGYSFYSFNSALHSANAFNDFARHALDDSLYFPAGIIGPSFYPDYERYDLSRSLVPPLFKATYYEVLSFDEIGPDTLKVRSDSIADYADRLHEIVEFVKNVTGSDEVDIVAHSMGGLVTRMYIDEYGDSSFGNIVLVGTPNHGVPRRLLHLCKFFGGQTECDEMYEKSPFMHFLNNDAMIPEKEVHMLIGRGCSTFGADGDGIVQTRSAELDFASSYYFEGGCDLIDNFHRDMIKPSKYPDIYDKIISILLS